MPGVANIALSYFRIGSYALVQIVGHDVFATQIEPSVGGRIELQLKSTSFEDFTGDIPLLDSPKTLRDANNIFKALIINLLWIDCHCIIQACVLDWEEQSAKMSRVFSHDLVTIAADAAENSLAGFINGGWEFISSRTYCPLNIRSLQGPNPDSLP